MANTTNKPYKAWVIVMPGTGEDPVDERMRDIANAEAASINPDEVEDKEYEDKLKANAEARKIVIDKLDNVIKKNQELGVDDSGQKLIKDKKNEEYDKKRYEILADKQIRSPGISSFYLNANVKKQINENAANPNKRGNFRVEVLQGVGTKYLNPAYMNPETGKMKSYKPFLARVKGFITGAGEKQNIEYTLKLLRTAADKTPSELPERLILNGHSRGAAACIELARAIYLEHGDAIKIAMNISDPVPGPGRRDKSKLVIPPNVDSLVITYAQRPSGLMDQAFNPLDINEILFDPSKTTVTTTTLPVSHTLVSKNSEGYIDSDILGVLGEINTGIVKAIGVPEDASTKNQCHLESLDFKSLENLRADPKKNLPGVRAGRNFIVASDPSQNTSLPPALKEFHAQLQNKAYIKETNIESLRDSHRATVTQATTNIDTNSTQGRINMLDVIYREGNRANKLKQDKKFLRWKDTIGKKLINDMTDTEFKKEKNRIIATLNDEIPSLGAKDPDQTNKAIQKNIQAINDAVAVIDKVNRPDSEAKCADYYLTLLQLRDKTKEMNSSRSMLAKSFDLFNRSNYNNRTGNVINSAINTMIDLKKGEETEIISHTIR
jgi:hypothetical protein